MEIKVKGFWEQKKEKLKERFPIIKDEDLNFSEGKEREMIEMLGNKVGKTKEELVFIITRLD
ncbi:MAG: general stress protein CsbD [Ignavibacteriales bacterium]|nr:MAG: general stress protein CsbD [Ignavibacteriales bacterium]RPI76476.1 MAG: general stress protein CsbD [Ignavibacteriales bacterium]